MVLHFHDLTKAQNRVTLYVDCQELQTFYLETKLKRAFHKNNVQQAVFRLGNAGSQSRLPLYGDVRNPSFVFGGTIDDIHGRYEECSGYINRGSVTDGNNVAPPEIIDTSNGGNTQQDELGM